MCIDILSMQTLTFSIINKIYYLLHVSFLLLAFFWTINVVIVLKCNPQIKKFESFCKNKIIQNLHLLLI